MKIGNYAINEKSDPYIIAEAGVNHNGSYELAIRLIDAAIKAGAHAIKWQIYKAETLCTRNAPRFWNWEGEEVQFGTQFDSYSLLDKFPLEDYRRLSHYCRENGIEFLATPFDKEAVEFLESIQVSAYKIASCDCNNIPLIRMIAKTQKPILLSTGASSLEDIKLAVDTIKTEDNHQIALLHCILKYPTAEEDANLEMIKTLKKHFPDCTVGFSDHTLGTDIAIASAAFGADVIEKHYTVDKTLQKSADHWLSVNPQELKQIVVGAARVKKAIGKKWARPLSCEESAKNNARRSIVTNLSIVKGSLITENMLTCKRPGIGLEPRHLNQLIGKKAVRDISEDSLVELSDFE